MKTINCEQFDKYIESIMAGSCTDGDTTTLACHLNSCRTCNSHWLKALSSVYKQEGEAADDAASHLYSLRNVPAAAVIDTPTDALFTQAQEEVAEVADTLRTMVAESDLSVIVRKQDDTAQIIDCMKWVMAEATGLMAKLLDTFSPESQFALEGAKLGRAIPVLTNDSLAYVSAVKASEDHPTPRFIGPRLQARFELQVNSGINADDLDASIILLPPFKTIGAETLQPTDLTAGVVLEAKPVKSQGRPQKYGHSVYFDLDLGIPQPPRVVENQREGVLLSTKRYRVHVTPRKGTEQ